MRRTEKWRRRRRIFTKYKEENVGNIRCLVIFLAAEGLNLRFLNERPTGYGSTFIECKEQPCKEPAENPAQDIWYFLWSTFESFNEKSAESLGTFQYLKRDNERLGKNPKKKNWLNFSKSLWESYRILKSEFEPVPVHWNHERILPNRPHSISEESWIVLREYWRISNSFGASRWLCYFSGWFKWMRMII